MSLANLGVCMLYWVPAQRRITARSLCVTRHFKLPPGAVLIGTYASPFPALTVLEDLQDLLAHPPAKPRPAAKAEPTSIAAPKPLPETSWTWAPARFAFPLRK